MLSLSKPVQHAFVYRMPVVRLSSAEAVADIAWCRVSESPSAMQALIDILTVSHIDTDVLMKMTFTAIVDVGNGVEASIKFVPENVTHLLGKFADRTKAAHRLALVPAPAEGAKHKIAFQQLVHDDACPGLWARSIMRIEIRGSDTGVTFTNTLANSSYLPPSRPLAAKDVLAAITEYADNDITFYDLEPGDLVVDDNDDDVTILSDDA